MSQFGHCPLSEVFEGHGTSDKLLLCDGNYSNETLSIFKNR